MLFSHDTTSAVLLAADLVNATRPATGRPETGPLETGPLDTGSLGDVAGLERFLDAHEVEPRRQVTQADLAAVLALAPRLLQVWLAPDTAARSGHLNRLLDDSGARPRLVDHGGGWGWHLHVTGPDATLEDQIAAQTAFGLADLVRAGEESRLRICAAPDCQAVLVDLSRNRSRRFCDTGNCGNRQHVAAYRERLAGRDLATGG